MVISQASEKSGPLRALHIVGGLDQADGGPAYSVPRLCQSLRDQGIDAEIYTLGKKQEDACQAHFSGQSFKRIPLLKQLKLSSSLRAALRRNAPHAHVIHSHGLWIAPNIYAGKVATALHKPLVVSPRGMLSPGALRFSAKKKQAMWQLWQGPAYANAAAWHATSRLEADEIRDFGIRAPIAIIPNGIDLPDQTAKHQVEKEQRTVLFLSRIHPKKGISRLLEAWRQLAGAHPDWQMVIAGPDEGGHLAELKKMVRQDNIQRVTFSGPVYGEVKASLLADADVFVLPTLSENFGIAVAEALAAGIPSIVTTGAPWQGLQTNKCGWWIEQGIEPMRKALTEALTLPASERQAMGLRGREWMRREFGWEAIGRDMKEVYLWLADNRPLPPCVELA